MNTNSITPSDRKLLTEISHIGYGSMENLELKNGIVTANASSRKVRTYKPTHSKVTRQGTAGAFELKDCQVEFLQQIHAIGNGFIRSILVQDGLPVLWEIEEALTAI